MRTATTRDAASEWDCSSTDSRRRVRNSFTVMARARAHRRTAGGSRVPQARARRAGPERVQARAPARRAPEGVAPPRSGKLNLASRLEGRRKPYGVFFLVSESTRRTRRRDGLGTNQGSTLIANAREETLISPRTIVKWLPLAVLLLAASAANADSTPAEIAQELARSRAELTERKRPGSSSPPATTRA